MIQTVPRRRKEMRMTRYAFLVLGAAVQLMSGLGTSQQADSSGNIHQRAYLREQQYQSRERERS